MKKKKWICLLLVAVIAAAAVTLAACNAGSSDYGTGSDSADEVAKTLLVADSEARMLSYTVAMTLSVDSVKTSADQMLASVKAKGGWISESSENLDEDGNYNYFYYTVKVPTEKLDEFLGELDAQGTMRRKTVYTTDLTDQYVSAASRKTALETSRATYQAILDGGGISIGDTITLQNKIAEIDGELHSLETQISNFESLSDYSTVTVNFTQKSDGLGAGDIAAIVFASLFAAAAAGVTVLAVVLKRKKKALKTAAEPKE